MAPPFVIPSAQTAEGSLRAGWRYTGMVVHGDMKKEEVLATDSHR